MNLKIFNLQSNDFVLGNKYMYSDATLTVALTDL